MRLIDADHLLSEIAELKKSPWYNNFISGEELRARIEAVEIIEDLCIKKEHTAVERPKGKWETDNAFGKCAYVCSNCSTIWTSSEIENMHYCPTCGADMRKVEDSLWDKAIKADDIKKDDEWMQDDKWDEIYKEAEE